MDVYSPLVLLSFEGFWLIFDHYDWTRHFDLDVVLYGWFCLLPLQKCVLQFFLALPFAAFLDLLFLSLRKKVIILQAPNDNILMSGLRSLLIHHWSCAFFRNGRSHCFPSNRCIICLNAFILPLVTTIFLSPSLCTSAFTYLNTPFTSEATDNQ